jgi:hypothetical protein
MRCDARHNLVSPFRAISEDADGQCSVCTALASLWTRLCKSLPGSGPKGSDHHRTPFPASCFVEVGRGDGKTRYETGGSASAVTSTSAGAGVGALTAGDSLLPAVLRDRRMQIVQNRRFEDCWMLRARSCAWSACPMCQ